MECSVAEGKCSGKKRAKWVGDSLNSFLET